MEIRKIIASAMALAISCTSIPATQVLYLGSMTAGAADSSKGFELRTYLDVNGNEVSPTISADAINAGDVTIPVGLFLKEGETDSLTLSAQWTVKSSDGDASNTYVTFRKHEIDTDYFKNEQNFTLADGTSCSTKTIVGFAGKIIDDEEEGNFFSPYFRGQSFAEANSNAANTPNAFASTIMTCPTTTTYNWTGSKSDEYPVYVVDVVFAKGTPAGTYSLEFCDYSYDDDFPDNMSNMIETFAGKMTTKNSKLTLKGLDITVGGNGEVVSTTTASTTQKTEATTTTATSGQTTPSGDVDEKFIVKPENVEVLPGETVSIGIYAKNYSNRKAGQFVAQVIDANLPIEGATATMKNLRCSAVPVFSEYMEINGEWYCDTLVNGEAQEILTDKPVARFSITVPYNTEAGTYEWKLDKFHIVESGYDAVEFDAVLETGKIIVIDDSLTTVITHNNYTFGKVNSYPTKTIYECGEELDLSGLEFESSKGHMTYDESDLYGGEGVSMHNSVIREDGTSYDVSEFSTLPAGKYTVVLEGTAGEYYADRLCKYVYISYKVTIKQGTVPVSTTTPGDQSATSDNYIDEKFIVKPEDKEINAGDTVTVGIYAENGSNRKAAQFIAQVIDANLPIPGATATMSKVKCSAVPGACEYIDINGTWYCDTLDSGEPQEINTEKPVARFDITVPVNAKAGTYEWKLDRFHVVESGYDAIEFDAVLKTGKIIVRDDSSSDVTTHQVYTFGKVNSYPTKTIYECGEEIDLSGLKFESEGGGQTYDAKDILSHAEGTAMHNSVIGEDGTSHEISEFSTLPAGEYTVVLEGSAGSYYDERYCINIYISYKVTIKQGTVPETATTTLPVLTTEAANTTTATVTTTVPSTTAISVEKLFGTWSEETPHNPGDLPIVFSFYEDGTARISWKNDPSGYYVPITWSTEDDILQYHEDVEDGSDASYFISFSNDALVLKKNKDGEAAYVLNKESLPLGDVNNDGKVDAKDASLILVEYASLSTDGKSVLSNEAKTAADVNKDGKADSKDASAVLQYYAYTSTGGNDSIEVFLK